MLVIGEGRWAEVYRKTLNGMPDADGVILATHPQKHYEIGSALLKAGIPVLIEKPVSLCPSQADELVSLGGIAFAGHTRLYSPAWERFKERLGEVREVECEAGGTHRDPWWDWGPHLVSMCLDIGFDPAKARIRVTKAPRPLSFVVNGVHCFADVPTNPSPLEVLLGRFIAAIRKGEPNNDGLRLGAEVVRFLWDKKCHSPTTPQF